ncbi:MAG TPA: glucan biosynthesis protein G [Steroidobacter sp.]|nr:glucan biosynthesis protein G [Steroidobacter sp.]
MISADSSTTRAGRAADDGRTGADAARDSRSAHGFRGWGAMALVIAFSCVAAADALRSGPQREAARQRFSAELVLEAARAAAAAPFTRGQIDGPAPLPHITYDQYRDIRFNSDYGVWRNEQVPFRVELLAAGFLYQEPVTVSVVESGYARQLTGEAQMFVLGPSVAQPLAGQVLPLSGFRVRTRLNSRSVWDEFLVFQGASYFRAIDRGGSYGVSARGLALRTAHPMGEEFPTFTRFWIERPAANAVGLVVHALLESESTTGAYRFSIIPGAETIMDVELTLFPRKELDHVGLAPLTSMFLFDESERTRIDDFRDEVHDSDGLQIVMATGERVWRPLRNPTQLQVSSFTSQAPRAFGLIQRSRRASDYHDLEARYEDRPSAWIEPTSDWGEGSVELIEIPADNEYNDNIVSYWRPKDVIPAGRPWSASYRIRWTSQPRLMPELGKVSATRTGPTFDGKRRLFVIDFTGAGRSVEGLQVDAGASAGALTNLVLQPNRYTGGVRASFELDPGDATVAELRLRLLRTDRGGAESPASETWLYRWTAS